MNNFDITLEQLKNASQHRGQDAAQQLSDFRGTSGLCQLLKTSASAGIVGHASDLQSRRDAFGSNFVPPKPPKTFIQLLFKALKDTTVIILICAALLGLGLAFVPGDDNEGQTSGKADWIEGAAILITVSAVMLVSALYEWTKERQFRGLKMRIDGEQRISVIRNGEPLHLPIAELVVGDLVQVKYGDSIPADGYLVQANDLKLDESALTGESDHVKKSITDDPLLLRSTHVMEGSGKMIVTAVGLNSQAGIIFTLLGATSDENDGDQGHNSADKPNKRLVRKALDDDLNEGKSVLQAKLSRLAIQIGYGGMVLSILTVVIMSVKFGVHKYAVLQLPFVISDLKKFVSYFILGITVLVVAVPEGLPLAVTIALAFSVKMMTRDNNLVRHLDACETMGNATTICSDKTGTLTTNRMTVVQSYIGGRHYKLTPQNDQLDPATRLRLANAVAINSGYSSHLMPSERPGELPKQLGNKTECALLGFVTELGESYEKVREKWPESRLHKVYTFNSERKSMTTVIENEGMAGFTVYTKGASEIVLKQCNYILDEDGKPRNLSITDHEQLTREVIEPMASNGLRTICIAEKQYVASATQSNQVECQGEPMWENEAEIVSGLTCLAIVGIEDPLRPEVPDAIRKCQRAGITVRMVTGDNVNTACSIAAKCGILKPNSTDHLVLDGKQFNRLVRDPLSGKVSQDEMDKVWPRLRVLARSQPQDKYNLVKGIIDSKVTSSREVVAVTGDGTNDAPALKRADVGFAMGITGTDVAKEASDIILTDDNFTSIVRAVLWGRNVYDAIAKYLQFQLTVNGVAVVVASLSGCIINDSPLKPIQMLWMNLILDSLASLALAAEHPSDELLQRKPYGRTRPVISRIMMRNIIGQAVYQLAVIFCLLVFGADEMLLDIESGMGSNTTSQHFTIIFNTFVIMTLFNEVNSRKIHGQRNVLEGLATKRLFIVLWIASFGLQVLVIFFGGSAFSVEALSLDQWLWCIFFGFGVLIWGQVVSSIPMKQARKTSGADQSHSLVTVIASGELEDIEQRNRLESSDFRYQQERGHDIETLM